MSEMLPSMDDLTKSVLAGAKECRERQILDSAVQGLQADDRLERQGDLESHLHEEVVELRERMEWLHRHPRLRRFIGRSAVTITYQSNLGVQPGIPDVLSTPLILEGEKTVEGAHELVHGYVFWRFFQKYGPQNPSTLYVENAVRDVTTGYQGESQAYAMYPYEDKTGRRVQIRGGEFRHYAENEQRRAYNMYVAVNPWAQRYHYGDQEMSSGQRVWRVHPWSGPKETPYNERQNRRWQMDRELMSQYEPGPNTWNYPNDMFWQPLQLVSQANEALGRFKWV